MTKSWPDTADGDVFRRLEANGFDFGEPCWIDFNVDFETSTPPTRAIDTLTAAYPNALIQSEEDGERCYLLVKFFDRLSYEFVVQLQDELSKLMIPLGGICESWGVLS
jgi:hypothetical protein